MNIIHPIPPHAPTHPTNPSWFAKNMILLTVNSNRLVDIHCLIQSDGIDIVDIILYVELPRWGDASLSMERSE